MSLLRLAAVLVTLAVLVPAASAQPPNAPSPAVADEAAPAESPEVAAIRALEASLTYRTGAIDLVDGKARLSLPAGYRYLGPDDTSRVLEAWGNPANTDTGGMMIPPGVGLFDEDGWAVVLGYTDDGHVNDADAESIDYADLLAQMQREVRTGNAERTRLGLATAELRGWAEPPSYDRATRKLYWAKELQFSTSDQATLNYAVRVLGRTGVLELNAVATMSQLATVKPAMDEVLGFAEFTPGNRYADYQPGTDRDAEYGVAALVAGGVAAKVLGTKGFWAALFAAKKFLVLGAIGLAGVAGKVWSWLRSRARA